RPHVLTAALVFSVIALAVWFIKAPTPRFGIGMLIILPVVISLSLLGLRRMEERKLLPLQDKILNAMHSFPCASRLRPFIERDGTPYLLGCLLVFTLAAKFGIFNASLRHIILPFDMLAAPAAVGTQPDKNFGIRSGPDCECWLEKYCSPDDRPPIGEHDGYKY